MIAMLGYLRSLLGLPLCWAGVHNTITWWETSTWRRKCLRCGKTIAAGVR